MLTLETIMTRHVVTVSLDDDLAHVRQMFNRYKFHHVVVEERCKAVGIISDRDLLANLSPFLGKPTERALDEGSLHRKAHQIMTRTIISALPSTPVGDAALLLLNNNISCLPVLDEQQTCVGIVTWRDMLRWALKDLTTNECALKALAGSLKHAA